MTRLAEVNTCGECPYAEFLVEDGSKLYCDRFGGKRSIPLNPDTSSPSWCPLSQAAERPDTAALRGIIRKWWEITSSLVLTEGSIDELISALPKTQATPDTAALLKACIAARDYLEERDIRNKGVEGRTKLLPMLDTVIEQANALPSRAAETQTTSDAGAIRSLYGKLYEAACDARQTTGDLTVASAYVAARGIMREMFPELSASP